MQESIVGSLSYHWKTGRYIRKYILLLNEISEVLPFRPEVIGSWRVFLTSTLFEDAKGARKEKECWRRSSPGGRRAGIRTYTGSPNSRSRGCVVISHDFHAILFLRPESSNLYRLPSGEVDVLQCTLLVPISHAKYPNMGSITCEWCYQCIINATLKLLI